MSNSLIVLGVHRSGTSALSGALNILGYTRPKSEIRPSAENPSGFFESILVARLNDLLLSATGATWDSLHSCGEELRQPFDLSAFEPAALEILKAEFGTSSSIFLKDPRICRLYDFWGDVLNKSHLQHHIVFAVRHPKEVANSLRKRNGFSLPKGMLIWLLDILNAEYSTRHLNRVFVRYPDFCTRPVEELRRIEETLAIRFPNELEAQVPQLEHFFDDKLHRNREASDTNLLPQTKQISQIFFEWSRTGERSKDYSSLDQARATLLSTVQQMKEELGSIDPITLYETFHSS